MEFQVAGCLLLHTLILSLFKCSSPSSYSITLLLLLLRRLVDNLIWMRSCFNLKQWKSSVSSGQNMILIKDLDDLILGLVEQEIDIFNNRIVQKQKREESILFNFHKNKYLAQYTTWKRQKNDGSPEYDNLCKNKILQKLISIRFKHFKAVLHIPTYNHLKNYYFHDVLYSFIQYTYSQNFASQHH